jgi:predicted lactoylglutathione lyase
MWDHVTIRVSDRDAAKRFYEPLLRVLGYELTHPGEHFDEWNDFGISQASDEKPVTRNLHVAFVARSRVDVDAFWRAGVDAGYESDGEPAERPQYSETYYGAFLLDPDGNSAEAIHTEQPRPGDNVIDHMWIGVSEVPAAKRFYETIAPVDDFHRVATAAGYESNGAPGERTVNHAGYYGAFVLDPDGNNVEAVKHNRPG